MAQGFGDQPKRREGVHRCDRNPLTPAFGSRHGAGSAVHLGGACFRRTA
jgi:hypothetical protein